MAEGSSDTGIHKVIPSKGDSPHRRREKIVVIGTILLVILTVVLVAHRASGGAAVSDQDDSDPGETGIAGPDDSTDEDDGTTGSTGGGGSDGSTTTGTTAPATGVNKQVANLRKRLAKQRTLAQTRKGIVQGQARQIRVLDKTVTRLDHPINHKGKRGQQHPANRVVKPLKGAGVTRPKQTPPRQANI